MRKKQLLLILLSFSLLLVQCRFQENKNETASEAYEEQEGEEFENEDGIREAQEMDFEMTRDNRLGYVPASRLVDAYNRITLERRAGRYARTSALNWVERGPNTNTIGPSNGNFRGPGPGVPVVSGRMRAVHVDLNDASNKTVWAASVSGGLWKTNDITANPANWILVNDFLGNLAISSITQSPANKNIMYFATGERNNNVDAVRGGGVWKSIDGGVTWNLLTNTTGFWNVSKIVCDAAGNVYVGTNGNNQGLQRSTNGGTSWTNITPTNPGNSNSITDIKVSSTGRLHVTMSGTNGAGSYFTDNGATVTSASWTTPITPIPNLNANCEIAVAGNVLYALPEGASAQTPQIYKSTDGGLSWLPTPTSPPSPASEPTINPGQGWYNLAIGIDPSNPDICVAGGLNFYRTTDGGSTWNQITRWVGTALNYVHADHHGVFWNGTQVLLSTDGGIFYSNNNGVSYADRNVGIRTLQFYSCALHPTNNFYLGGTQDNGSHSVTATTGIGGSIEVHGGDGGYTHIDEDEPQFQFSATTRSSYRRSTNSGVNWSSVTFSTTIGQFINPTDYDDINNRMYCSAAAGTYVRWENAQTGGTFNTITISGATPNSIRSFKVSPFTPNRVFMGTAGGAVVRVDDAHLNSPNAVNITDITMPQTNGNIVSCVNTGTSDNFLIATYSNYGLPHVWVSTNGGTSWSNVNGNLPDVPVRWAMFYPEDNSKAIIATEMGIFETDQLNGSSTNWVQNSTFPNVKTNMLQYRVSDRTILAATHGRGFWTTTIPTVNPTVRFASSYNYSRTNIESTVTTDGCRSYRDIVVNMLVDAAPVGTATVTLSVDGTSTAIEGIDYDITTNGNFVSPSKSLQFTDGGTGLQPVTIRIYDDAAVEGNEFFVLKYSVSGATNAVAAANPSYTIHIGDNDVVPQPTTFGTYTVGTNGFGGYVQPLRGEFSKSRSQYLYRADELTAAGVLPGTITSLALNVISKASTQPYNALSISLKSTNSTDMSGGLETGFTVCHTSTYTSTVGINTFNFNANSFVWDGVSNIIVEICFDNSTGTASDNVASSTTTYQSGIWGRGNLAIPGCSLDASVTTLFSGVGTNNDRVRPDITLGVISTISVETVLNRSRTNIIGGASTSYFLPQGFRTILSSVGNSSAPLGCVSFNVQEAGTTWQNYYGGQRSQKVIDVSLTGNAAATYTIGLYFTASELGGKTPSTLNIGRTTAVTLAGANSSNTTVFGTTVSGFGSDYIFTATVSGTGHFFLTDGSVTTSVIDVTRSGETFVKLMQNPLRGNVFININNEQRRNINASLFTSNGQLIRTWNLGKAVGPTELSLNGTTLSAGTYVLRVFADNRAQSLKLVKN
jgi:hypothetical protein